MAMSFAANLRSLIARLSRHTPMFRGKGRMVLFADACLTDASNVESCVVIDTVNELASFQFDLRPWGQKFAYYYGQWEHDHVSMIRKLYRGGVFIDVGSSLGLYVVCMADLVAKASASIISIEPISENLVRQKRNVEINGCQNLVRYHQLALGSTISEIRISFDKSSGDNNAIISSDGGMTTPVTTLDSLLGESDAEQIGLIKIDVEGYEPKVIEGARETIARDRPVVFAEFNRERMAINGFDMVASWSFFVDCRYRAYQLSEGKLRQLDQPGVVENIYFVPS